MKEIGEYRYFSGPYDVGGISFSPNSSILYLLAHREIYQFDLNSENVIESKNFVDTADSYLDTTPGSDIYIPHTFFCGQLGPDGKIYISSISSVRVLSTIDRPDKWGKDCQLNQHSIHLPSLNYSTLSNNPNYRLGPVDGSPCDTLGIDNIPLAKFRSDQSTEDYLKFDFVDLSDYEPAEWHWDFGDGNSGTEINPVHTYSQPGIYEVCLTVTNENGSDTYCQIINLATTSTNEQGSDIQIGIFPNPCISFVNIQLKNYYPKSAHVYLYDTQGRLVIKKKINHGLNLLNLANLNTGMYFYSIIDNGAVLKQGRISKQ